MFLCFIHGQINDDDDDDDDDYTSPQREAEDRSTWCASVLAVFGLNATNGPL